MADPKGMTEIEDVLSSIRRLVASDTRTGPAAAEPAEPKADPVDRLVLTPALRIDEPSTRIDIPEAEPEADALAGRADAAPELGVPLADPLRAWEEDSRADRAALPVEADDIEQTLAALEAELAGDMAMEEDPPASGHDGAADAQDGLEPLAPEGMGDADGFAPPDLQDSAGEPPKAAARGKRSGFIWEGAFEDPLPETDPLPPDFAAFEPATEEELAPLAVQGSETPEDEFGHPQPEPMMATEDVLADDDLAAGQTEAPQDMAMPDLPAEPVVAARTPMPEAPAPADDAEMSAADLTAEPDDTDADLTGADLFDPQVELPFDEAQLREIVTEIIRDELRGALGDRIARNLRKLVRQELRRELAALGLDTEG